MIQTSMQNHKLVSTSFHHSCLQPMPVTDNLHQKRNVAPVQRCQSPSSQQLFHLTLLKNLIQMQKEFLFLLCAQKLFLSFPILLRRVIMMLHQAQQEYDEILQAANSKCKECSSPLKQLHH